MTAKWREERGGTREKREVKAAGSRLTSNQRVLATPTHRPDEHGSLPIPTSFLLPRPAFYLNGKYFSLQHPCRPLEHGLSIT